MPWQFRQNALAVLDKMPWQFAKCLGSLEQYALAVSTNALQLDKMPWRFRRNALAVYAKCLFLGKMPLAV